MVRLDIIQKGFEKGNKIINKILLMVGWVSYNTDREQQNFHSMKMKLSRNKKNQYQS